MTTTLKKHTKREHNPDVMTSRVFAEVFHAFLECSDEVQNAIRDMVSIVNDDDATEDERLGALETIAEALFPSGHNGAIGIDLKECEGDAPNDIAKTLADMDSQEASFAERVNAVLAAKKMTQGDLAERVGIGQPAVSMMLSRQCRPQRRTVEKIAAALEVKPQDIWPELSE